MVLQFITVIFSSILLSKASIFILLIVIKGSSGLHLPGADFNHREEPKAPLRRPEEEKLLQDSVQVAHILCRERLLE